MCKISTLACKFNTSTCKISTLTITSYSVQNQHSGQLQLAICKSACCMVYIITNNQINFKPVAIAIHQMKIARKLRMYDTIKHTKFRLPNTAVKLYYKTDQNYLPITTEQPNQYNLMTARSISNLYIPFLYVNVTFSSYLV